MMDWILKRAAQSAAAAALGSALRPPRTLEMCHVEMPPSPMFSGRSAQTEKQTRKRRKEALSPLPDLSQMEMVSSFLPFFLSTCLSLFQQQISTRRETDPQKQAQKKNRFSPGQRTLSDLCQVEMPPSSMFSSRLALSCVASPVPPPPVVSAPTATNVRVRTAGRRRGKEGNTSVHSSGLGQKHSSLGLYGLYAAPQVLLINDE